MMLDQQHAEHRPVVLAPSYNNGRTVIDVLEQVEALGFPIVVVDDGCTDRTPELLAGWSASRDRVTVLTHEVNRGKATALRNGFKHAREAGFTHVITVDTDGQLDPQDILPLLERSRELPTALIIGARNTDAEGYPRKNMIGRRFSSLFIWIECGIRIDDSQCGLRIYPLDVVNTVRCHASRFAFETEILTRTAWAGFRIVEVPITGKYFQAEDHVSHYRPWIDTIRITGLHFRLVLRALLPWPHRRVIGMPVRRQSAWQRFLEWINPRKIISELHGTKEERGSLAVGLALGTFIANTPLYGLHTLIALYVSKRLSVHPLSVVLGTQLAIPPIGPLLITIAIVIGQLLLHGNLSDMPEIDGTLAGFLRIPGQLFLEWTIGSLVVGTVCMLATFFTALTFLNLASDTDDSEPQSEQPLVQNELD